MPTQSEFANIVTHQDNQGGLASEREAIVRSGRLHWFHWLVVVLSLVLTFFAWRITSQQVEVKNSNQFDRIVQQILALVSERMRKYEDGLWGGVAAIQAQGGDVNLKQWQVFAKSLRIDAKYPGINGIGVIHYVAPGQLGQYLARQQRARPKYQIHPKHTRSEFLPITYIEPAAENAKAVGLDMAHEKNRYEAARKARRTGEAQITAPIVLVQDTGHTPGFLFYAPFFKAGFYKTRQNRRENFSGMVYAPFVFHKLIEGLLGKDRRQVRIRIKDGQSLLYDELVDTDPEVDPKPVFSRTVDLKLYGRTWSFDISTAKSFRSATSSDQPKIILAGGILIDSLLLILFLALSRSNRRAVRFADQMTGELEKKAAALQKSNVELEQFAYVASHDLKAPLRAIDSLAELIEDDVGDNLTAESRTHLAMLRGRSKRLKMLLESLLEYARIGRDDVSFSEVDSHALLREVVELLNPPAGIKVEVPGNLPSFETNSVPLQQIFQNLIGNSIKHHDRKQGLIEIACRDLGSHFEFEVRDDGPGISAKYHDKIFKMFQTLKRRDETEGSGMGLAIVEKLVQENGGAISVISPLGDRGSSFTFTWQKINFIEERLNAA